MGRFTEQLRGEDFREAPQLGLLLQALRRGVAVPFERLPAVTALFLAEAALQLQHPGAPLFKLLNSFLLKRPALDLQVRM